MIKFETIQSVDEQVFDRLFAESKSILDGGSYPWELFNITTDEEKRAHLLNSFNRVINDIIGIGWHVVVDGEVLLLCAGIKRNDLIKWDLGLCGTRNGSRSWLYDADYEPARNAFWDSQGVRGWIMAHAGNGKDVYNHVLNKKEAGHIVANVETKPSEIPGFTDIIVTK